MSGFSNPIIGGGGALVYPSIHSPDYVEGQSGWTVNKDGSAEFNDLEIRGTFHGVDYVINSHGLFFYSAAPAAGNLVGSWANAAGQDKYGNGYAEGICIGVANNTEIQVRPDLDGILIYAS